MSEQLLCPECGAANTYDQKLSFRAECDCGQDLHICVTCTFYDRYAENQCREVTAEPVSEKRRRNFCEFYRVAVPAETTDAEAIANKAKLDALFGKTETTEVSAATGAKTAALSRLDELFKKNN